MTTGTDVHPGDEEVNDTDRIRSPQEPDRCGSLHTNGDHRGNRRGCMKGRGLTKLLLSITVIGYPAQ